MKQATAFAPASVGNIGVGFDILGHTIAGPGDRATVRRIDAHEVRIAEIRNNTVELPLEAARNTAGAALIALRAALNLTFGFEVERDKVIAFGSVMGGSAASAVAALVAANALLDHPFVHEALYPFALEGEAVASGGYHGDNVGAMLHGGIVLATRERLVRVPAPKAWHCVVVHPDATLETRRAREALTGAYALTEFVAQSANLALVLSGCHLGDASLVRAGLRDVLVDPPRAPPIPGFTRLNQAAPDPHALGASISEAGPSVFAWTEDIAAAAAAAPAMRAGFSEAGIASESFVSPSMAPGGTCAMVVSTRGNAPAVSLSEAINAGLAPDGGLYVPQSLPGLASSGFPTAATLAETAAHLLKPFFADDALASQLSAICAESFAFDTPLRELATPRDHVLELFHGPTAAFKDFGARFLVACMQRIPRNESQALTILVATSGDTGAAVGSAFAGIEGFRVVILYPDGRVSPRQAHQLGCFGDNISALRVAGSFDDCQRLVKQAFADVELRTRVPLSSANSISLGRLPPQMAYYAHAALDHWHAQEVMLNFVVPTGNLGNAFACVLARACGLPIGKVVFATNANLTLHDFFAGADYQPRASVATPANAMDVGAPSNFERLCWMYPDATRLRREFVVDAIGNEAIAATIRSRHATYGELFCPHTATAIRTLEALRQEGASGHWAAVATAHPAKFEGVIEPLIGAPVAVPPALAELLVRPSRAEPLAADYAALHAYLAQA